MSNTLQTLTNNQQTGSNILPTTRKRQMVWLATLTAITLIGQYVLLGLTGLGEARHTLPAWFTGFELVLWGLRALVEIAVVVYIAMTKTDTDKQSRVLWAFKVVLILMIVFTVGPIWASGPLGVSVVEILGYNGVVAWGMALAGISATMLAGVATAYKYQPVDEGYFVLPVADYAAMVQTLDNAIAERNEYAQIAENALRAKHDAETRAAAIMEAGAIFSLLPGTALARVVALFNDGRPDPQTIAEAFGLSPTTVRGVYHQLENGKQ